MCEFLKKSHFCMLGQKGSVSLILENIYNGREIGELRSG